MHALQAGKQYAKKVKSATSEDEVAAIQQQGFDAIADVLMTQSKGSFYEAKAMGRTLRRVPQIDTLVPTVRSAISSAHPLHL